MNDTELVEILNDLIDSVLGSGLTGYDVESDQAISKAKAAVEKLYGMGTSSDTPEIEVTEYPDGVRFGANDDVIMSAQVLRKFYIKREEVLRAIPSKKYRTISKTTPSKAYDDGYNQAIDDIKEELGL